jgi:curved DNA-binding protein CbpA
MNPYELLGVARDASKAQIRSAYRRLSKVLHPDNQDTGDAEKFRELSLAHDVLVDPERRRRYDETGRLSETRIKPAALKAFLASLIKNIVNAQTQSGATDDVKRENIQMKVVMSLSRSMNAAQQQRAAIERRIVRADELIARFVPAGEHDPVGEALRAEKRDVMQELDKIDDEIEMAQMAIKIFKEGYTYKADPAPEGPMSAGPTVFHSRGNSTYSGFGRGAPGS